MHASSFEYVFREKIMGKIVLATFSFFSNNDNLIILDYVGYFSAGFFSMIIVYTFFLYIYLKIILKIIINIYNSLYISLNKKKFEDNKL